MAYGNRIGFGALVLSAALSVPTVHAAVGVNKNFSPISTAVNQPARVTVTLLNPNAAPATDASLVDTLPAGLVVASPANASTTCEGGTVGAVAGGGSIGLSGGTVPAATTGPGTCTFSADVVAGVGGVYLNAIAAGALSSSQGSNLQATDATLTVGDTLPTGLSLGTLPAGCTASGQTVRCSVASLAVNGSASFVIPVTAQNALNGQAVSNGATATGGGDPGCPPGGTLDTLPARCQAAVTAPVSAPQLTLGKTASGSFAVGVPASYVLRVQNTGSVATAGTLVVTDVVPAGLAIGSLPAGCAAAGQQVTCRASDSLEPGAGTSFTIPVTPTVAAVPQVSNTATVLGGGDPVCPEADNCKATVVTTVSAPQLQIQQSANAPWTIGMGDASITLTVTNVGSVPTTGEVTVRASLPAGVAPGWTGTQLIDGWSCTATGQDVNCTATPAMGVGGVATVTLPVAIGAQPPAGSASLASVGGGGDPFNGGSAPAPGATCTALDAAVPGHCASLDISVPSSAAVTVTKALMAGVTTPLAAGQTVGYLLTATNSGGTTVSGYTVNEIVPAGTVLAGVADGSTAASTDCAAGAPAGTLCSVRFASVPAGGSATVEVRVVVQNPVPAGLRQIVNAITAPSHCSGATCDPPPTPVGCVGGHCVPAASCTAGDPLCVATPLAGAGAGGGGLTAVPTTSRGGLLLLAALLMLALGWRARAQRRR